MTVPVPKFVPSQPRANIFRRLRRMIFGLVPVVVWLGGIAGVFFLAQRQARPLDYPGMALVTRYIAAAPTQGQLKDLLVAERSVVRRGQLIGRLDDSALKLRLRQFELAMKTLEADRDRERTLREETVGRDKLEQANDLRRFQRDAENAQINLLRVKADIEETRLLLAALRVDLVVEERLSNQDLSSKSDYERTGYQAQALEKRISENEGVLRAREAKLKSVGRRLEDYKQHEEIDVADMDAVLSPFKWRIEVLKNEMEVINYEHTRLDLLAPADGRVLFVHTHPGELVSDGRPVVTIVDATPRGLVAYVPEGDAQQLKPGMAAILERSTNPGTTIKTKVLSIGPAVAELPAQVRGVPNVRQWGVPVYLQLTPEMEAVPGEALRVRVFPDTIVGG